MTEKLSVCFIWHMHQPLYKDRLSGKYLMPWVRLHAVKDYLDMPLILEDFPKIRQTFNIVPSLLEQLEDYAWHDAADEQLELTIKPENEYTEENKIAILNGSFHANVSRQIKPNAAYYALFQKRQQYLEKGASFQSMVAEFTNQEYADMVCWMNLAWIDPLWYRRSDLIKAADLVAIKAQGKNFTLEQRRRVIEIEREILKQVIPVYRRLQESGQIEVTTSPYYHPILPLLIDSNIARYPAPDVVLPERLYFHKEDARRQIEKGQVLFEETFGIRPQGMWPSELAVSPAALDLISQCGINWVVLDEGLLKKTLNVDLYRDEYGNLNSAELLCQPYRLQIGDRHINIIFRELVTSNEISFSYCHQPAAEAASNLYMRIKHIQQRLFDWEREGVVAIALDGENCWETFEQDGHPFLNELYRRLSQDSSLNVCTVSDYLERNPASTELHNIHSGSWINSDYHIWIGDPLKNRAWDLLSKTRHFLVTAIHKEAHALDIINKAWEEIYTAEGSDWFWWFGEPNNSAEDAVFDQQFRLRLQNVYKLLGESHPAELDVAIDKKAYDQLQKQVAEART